MSLKKYRKKRNFKVTEEPRGKKVLKKTGHLYVIQKHAASHLHYDFRLELQGVLLSWAVPKGPCLDPSVKRLAIHVEDHPLEYGSFEGTIPKGHYGAGAVLLWDKGKWYSEDENPKAAYHRGSMLFQLKGKKLQGSWKLVRMGSDDKTWLLIKVKDEYAKSLREEDITRSKPRSVVSKRLIDKVSKKETALKKKKKIEFPQAISPQLATLVETPPEGKKWLHEIKFDGYRLLVFKNGKKVTLFTRNQHDWTSRFKNIAESIKKLTANNLIMDGEVVVLDKKGRSQFQLLQNAIKNHSSEFIFYAFDLIYYNDVDLTTLKLIERKKILKTLLEHASQSLQYSDYVIGNGEKVYKKFCELGLEGVVSKDKDSSYIQKRSTSWLKSKCIKRQEFLIGGLLKSSKRSYFQSLMLGSYNDQMEFIYHGNVGTGFTETSLKKMYKLLSDYFTSKMPFKEVPKMTQAVQWVKPKIVVEIAFSEWTKDGILRQPSFKGIREDKSPNEIKMEIEMPLKKDSKKTKKYQIDKKSSDVKLTNPDKIIYPEHHITKQLIFDYYDEMAEWILPFIQERPLTLLRCPDNYHNCFYQKHLPQPLPTGIRQVRKGEDHFLYLINKEGLLSLSQLGVLEIHTWGCQVHSMGHPDLIVFDLDPDPSLPWKKVVKAAFDVRDILKSIHLKSYVKTTGGKGLHVVIPIQQKYNWNSIKLFSKTLAEFLVMKYPTEYLSKMTKLKRKNKIYVDYLRNQDGASSIAPYSTRAKKYAPIATPIEWDELTNDKRDTFFTLETLPARLSTLKRDPWHDFFKIEQSLDIQKLK